MAKKNRNNQSFGRMNKVKTKSKFETLNDYIELAPYRHEGPKLTDEEVKRRDTSLVELYPGAVLVNDWKELEEHAYDSETHVMDLDYTEWNDELVPYNGRLLIKEGEYEFNYLSTHCFYSMSYRESTHMLQKCGFNVIIKNWDGETI